MQTYIQTYFFLKGGNLDKGRWLCEDEGRDWGDVPTSPGIRQIASKPLKARRGMNRFPQKKAKLLTPWSWASSLPPELGGNIFLLFKPPILCYFVTAALANELEKAVAPHFSTRAWKILWTEEPGRLQRVGHDWAISLSLSCTGEGNGNPLQCSCLENSKDGGALWAAVYGVTQSRTRLKRLSSSSSIKHWNCGICLLGSQQVSGALTNKSTALPGRCFQLAHQSQTHTHTHMYTFSCMKPPGSLCVFIGTTRCLENFQNPFYNTVSLL